MHTTGRCLCTPNAQSRWIFKPDLTCSVHSCCACISQNSPLLCIPLVIASAYPMPKDDGYPSQISPAQLALGTPASHKTSPLLCIPLVVASAYPMPKVDGFPSQISPAQLALGTPAPHKISPLFMLTIGRCLCTPNAQSRWISKPGLTCSACAWYACISRAISCSLISIFSLWCVWSCRQAHVHHRKCVRVYYRKCVRVHQRKCARVYYRKCVRVHQMKCVRVHHR